MCTFWFGHSHFRMTFPMRSSQSHVLNSLTVRRPREKTKSHSLRHFTSQTCLKKPKKKYIKFSTHFQFYTLQINYKLLICFSLQKHFNYQKENRYQIQFHMLVIPFHQISLVPNLPTTLLITSTSIKMPLCLVD